MNVTPNKEPNNTTIDISKLETFPDAPRPDEPEGKQFVLVDGEFGIQNVLGLKPGDIITLVANDESGCPYFADSSGREDYLCWSRLAEVKEA